MKALSYAIFRHPSAATFEYRAYVRGLCWNIRMNRLLFPGWVTVVHADDHSRSRYGRLFSAHGALVEEGPRGEGGLGESMLWRLLPVLDGPYTRVLCRDADAITTYRETGFVERWLGTGKAVMALYDAPAHRGTRLMGGMVGFDCVRFRQLTGITTWPALIGGFDLGGRGSDQSLLNDRILPRLAREVWSINARWRLGRSRPHHVDPRLWEADLNCRHIGSAGVVDLSVIRFFRRFDPNPALDALEAAFPEVFYHHAP